MESILSKLKYSYLQINTLLWREAESEYIKAKNQEHESKRAQTGGASNDALDRLKSQILEKRKNESN